MTKLAATSQISTTQFRILCVLSLLFFVKVFLYGQFWLPMWDSADEFSHASYLKNLAEGKGLPVYPLTLMDDEVLVLAGVENAGDYHNYNSIHPPLYYLSMVPAYKLGLYFGDGNVETGFYWVRGMTAVFLGIAFYIFVLGFYRVVGDFNFAVSVVVILFSIPMLTHGGGGVTNDALALPLGAAVFLFWIKYMQKRQFKDLVIFGCLVGVSCVTKYFMLVFSVPLFGLTFFFLGNSWKERFKLGLLLGVLGYGLVLIVALRNYYAVGRLFPMPFQPPEILIKENFIDFMGTYQVFWRYFINFMGRIGFMDKVIHVAAVNQWVIIQSFLVTSILSWLFLARELYTEKKWMFAPFAVLLALVFILNFFLQWVGYQHLSLSVGFCFFVSCSGYLMFGPFLKNSSQGDVTKYWIPMAQVCVIFFLAVVLHKIYGLSLRSGIVRAAHGRYFFPFFGFWSVGFILPGLFLIKRWARFFPWVAAVFIINEFHFWYTSGIEHYVLR